VRPNVTDDDQNSDPLVRWSTFDETIRNRQNAQTSARRNLGAPSSRRPHRR